MREQVYTRWREGAVSQGLHEGAGLHKVEGGSSKSRFTQGKWREQ